MTDPLRSRQVQPERVVPPRSQGAPPDPTSEGATRIVLERARQMADEGWTPEHDDGHDSGELLKAAIGYALVGFVRDGETPPPTPPVNWPWHPSWWKPSGDPIRNLEKAGALIAAEIDRLTRSTSLDAPVSDETS